MDRTVAVTTERLDNVLVVHLDDAKANALSFDMIAAINAALDDAENDDDIRAVVLHGRPGKFSAGFDLGVMLGDDMSAIIGLVADGGELVHRISSSPFPVVAACTGHALAAGALVLLGCDVRVGADIDAKIGLNEVAIKMVLPDWALTIAMDRLSRRHLQRALANARITTPRDAVDVGFIDEVVPADDVLDRAVAVAAELAATLDPSAYARTIRAVRGSVLDQMAAQIADDRQSLTSPV
jgi:enoyl-CoA hydratase